MTFVQSPEESHYYNLYRARFVKAAFRFYLFGFYDARMKKVTV
jgi:hypothetical protein